MQPSLSFCIVLCLAMTTADARICPNLGSAVGFAAIGASAVTNTGITYINGNLGIYPGTASTGFASVPGNTGYINGNSYLGTPTAAQAKNDSITAYNNLAGATPTIIMANNDLAGKTLGPGVYKFGTTCIITLALTLNGTGVYVFQIGTSLTTSANTKILLINGATASCIFWQIGSSATLGKNSYFAGNIVAYASVWFGSGITHNGSAYAQTADITFISDNVNSQVQCMC